MFNSYARVCIDESDEDEAAAARLIRETAGGTSVPTVVTSTGAAWGRTQQGMQQRRGATGSGDRGAEAQTRSAVTASASAGVGATPASASVGNLIDLGDDLEPRPKSTTSGRQRIRPPAPSQPAVELVKLVPADPFFDLAASRPQQQQQQQQAGTLGGTAAVTPDGRQPQHPLDFLLYDGEEASSAGRDDCNTAASSWGARARPRGAFPELGSFSELLRGFGAPSTPASNSTTGIQRPGPGPGPAPSGGSAAWGPFSTGPTTVGTTAPGAAGSTHGSAWPSLTRHAHSQSSNGIDDLLRQQRAMREADTAAAAAAPGGCASAAVLPGAQGQVSGSGTHHKPPAIQRTDRSGPDVFDPFGSYSPAVASTTMDPGARAQGGSRDSGGGGTPPPAVEGADGSFTGGSGGGEGYSTNQRELLLYAVPLFKDKLVFLPVVNWKDSEDTSTVLGKVSAGVSNVQQNLSSMWHSLKDKGEFSAKIYRAGQAILENMNAEERLMKNIPKKASKLVVHHPAAIPPDEVQDQLTQLTATFCYKSVGKAAVAGVMLPVAVGLEVIAVPGIGWYTAYQLFKSTSAAAGGSRLNNYLKSDKSEVRVCYAPNTKMDLYILKSRLSPDGVLGSEDIEDLCHELQEPSLAHPLTELRNRHLRRNQQTKADYALLPMSAPDVDEQYGNNPKKKN